MSNSSIRSIDRTLSGATTLGQSWPGSNGNEGVFWSFTIRLFNVISRILISGRDLSPLQKCSWYILQPQPTGPLIGRGWLTFCRDAVDVDYSPLPSRLGPQANIINKNLNHTKCVCLQVYKRRHLYCKSMFTNAMGKNDIKKITRLHEANKQRDQKSYFLIHIQWPYTCSQAKNSPASC